MSDGPATEHDSALALAKEAVEVLETVNPVSGEIEYASRLRGREAVTALYGWLVGVNHVHTKHGIVYASAIYDVLTAVDAFLARDEVQALKGGRK